MLAAKFQSDVKFRTTAVHDLVEQGTITEAQGATILKQAGDTTGDSSADSNGNSNADSNGDFTEQASPSGAAATESGSMNSTGQASGTARGGKSPAVKSSARP